MRNMRGLIDKIEEFNKRPYGCWIAPTGEVIEVPYEQHAEQIVRITGMDYTDALDAGYVRVIYPEFRKYWSIQACAKINSTASKVLRSVVETRPEAAMYVDVDYQNNDQHSYKVPDCKTMLNLLKAARAGTLIDNIALDKFKIITE
jgi:hypothetical protein